MVHHALPPDSDFSLIVGVVNEVVFFQGISDNIEKLLSWKEGIEDVFVLCAHEGIPVVGDVVTDVVLHVKPWPPIHLRLTNDLQHAATVDAVLLGDVA